MAITLTQPFTVSTVALSGVPNTALKVTPPEFTRYLWIQFRGSAGALAYSGVDGDPLSGDSIQFAADDLVEIQHPGDKSVYLASPDPDTVVSIVAVERS
jgi:hypothetical protein